MAKRGAVSKHSRTGIQLRIRELERDLASTQALLELETKRANDLQAKYDEGVARGEQARKREAERLSQAKTDEREEGDKRYVAERKVSELEWRIEHELLPKVAAAEASENRTRERARSTLEAIRNISQLCQEAIG